MKKLIAFTTLALAAHFAQAGDMGRPPFGDGQPPSVEQRVKHMTKALSLTDEQAAQITEILNSREQERVNLATSLKELHDQEREQIDAVLTEEQKQSIASRHHKDHRDW